MKFNAYNLSHVAPGLRPGEVERNSTIISPRIKCSTTPVGADTLIRKVERELDTSILNTESQPSSVLSSAHPC